MDITAGLFERLPWDEYVILHMTRSSGSVYSWKILLGTFALASTPYPNATQESLYDARTSASKCPFSRSIPMPFHSRPGAHIAHNKEFQNGVSWFA